MQRTFAIALPATLLLAALSLRALAMQADGCEGRGFESSRPWRLTSAEVEVGPGSLETSIAVIEVALQDLDLMPVAWFENVQPQLNGAAFDLLEGTPAQDQRRFRRMLPALNIAIGRMVPGTCPADVYQAVEIAKTGFFLGGPRLVTTDGVPAEARGQLFGDLLTGSSPDQDDQRSRNGKWDSRIRLGTSKLADGTLMLHIDALIKRDSMPQSEVLFRTAAHIEDHGILVLAKRVLTPPVVGKHDSMWSDHPERVVLLFIQPRLP